MVLFKKIFSFFYRQFVQLKNGNKSVWKRKIWFLWLRIQRLPFILIAILPAILIVLFSRLLRPFILIRFEKFVSNRIGHFAGNIEQYLCELDAGVNKPDKNYIDIWFHPCPPCNIQLSRMWARRLNIGPRSLLEIIEIINDILPDGGIHKIGNNTKNDRDTLNLLEKFPPHLSFTSDEERLGKIGLRSIGVPDGKPFICLAVRDNAYLNNQSSHLDWSRHDYRDCDIQKYILAATKLAEKGYYVIRMGALVNESMNIDHPQIIDYATNGMRTDFMDIYLGAKCIFCISTTLGFDAVPVIFRRPVVYVDNPQLGLIRTENPNSISTIKKYWKRDEARFLTFKEIFQLGVDTLWLSKEYEENGIELFESSPDEIAAVVIEMEERLSGCWESSEEDERLQQAFWKIYPKSSYHGNIYSRIGTEYLQRYKGWLD
jgi:putative glycosyltransferase (TIGR04372 family)